MPYHFLTKDEILAIHDEMVRRYQGSSRIWDEHKLDAAVEAPRSGFGGELVHSTISEVAAAYWFHISQAHAFEAANKRTATTACFIFLRLNGYTVLAEHETIVQTALAVAAGEMDEPELAEWLRLRIEPRPELP